ncbi:MAG: glycoside hydrolase family 13 protein [Acidimicrobiia bacterium]
MFYQIFPDRFAASAEVAKPPNLEPWDDPPTSHGYKGGDLAGIVEHLDHLNDLGITALYLNPIFRSASNHRYHTHDYFTVDPLLGGNAAFRRMLDACHERGIKVVLDGVFNHASRGFFQFSDIAENHDRSPWRDWFHIHGYPIRPYSEDEPPSYEAWWNLHALPKFNTENPEAREFLMSVAEHWIRLGADGWRLDVPQEIRTDGFWEEFRTRVRAINPNAYIVGELWDDAPGWIGSRIDAVMHYQLGTAIIAYAAGGDVDGGLELSNPAYSFTGHADADWMAGRIRHLTDTYAPQTTTAHLVLLDSHDTARVASILRHDGGSLGLAALLLMTLPGAPCLYYGTEIGMEGGFDPDNRRAFPWDETRWDGSLLATWRELIALRHRHAALRSPAIDVHADGDLLVVRRGHDPEGDIVVTVNATHSQAAATVDLGADPARLWGPEGASHSEGRVTVPSRSGAVWSTS